MAINPYDKPAEQPMAQTYVPMPFKELYLGAKQVEDTQKAMLDNIGKIQEAGTTFKYDQIADKDIAAGIMNEVNQEVGNYYNKFKHNMTSPEAQVEFFNLKNSLKQNQKIRLLEQNAAVVDTKRKLLNDPNTSEANKRMLQYEVDQFNKQGTFYTDEEGNPQINILDPSTTVPAERSLTQINQAFYSDLQGKVANEISEPAKADALKKALEMEDYTGFAQIARSYMTEDEILDHFGVEKKDGQLVIKESDKERVKQWLGSAETQQLALNSNLNTSLEELFTKTPEGRTIVREDKLIDAYLAKVAQIAEVKEFYNKTVTLNLTAPSKGGGGGGDDKDLGVLASTSTTNPSSAEALNNASSNVFKNASDAKASNVQIAENLVQNVPAINQIIDLDVLKGLDESQQADYINNAFKDLNPDNFTAEDWAEIGGAYKQVKDNSLAIEVSNELDVTAQSMYTNLDNAPGDTREEKLSNPSVQTSWKVGIPATKRVYEQSLNQLSNSNVIRDINTLIPLLGEEEVGRILTETGISDLSQINATGKISVPDAKKVLDKLTSERAYENNITGLANEDVAAAMAKNDLFEVTSDGTPGTPGHGLNIKLTDKGIDYLNKLQQTSWWDKRASYSQSSNSWDSHGGDPNRAATWELASKMFGGEAMLKDALKGNRETSVSFTTNSTGALLEKAQLEYRNQILNNQSNAVSEEMKRQKSTESHSSITFSRAETEVMGKNLGGLFDIKTTEKGVSSPTPLKDIAKDNFFSYKNLVLEKDGELLYNITDANKLLEAVGATGKFDSEIKIDMVQNFDVAEHNFKDAAGNEFTDMALKFNVTREDMPNWSATLYMPVSAVNEPALNNKVAAAKQTLKFQYLNGVSGKMLENAPSGHEVQLHPHRATGWPSKINPGDISSEDVAMINFTDIDGVVPIDGVTANNITSFSVDDIIYSRKKGREGRYIVKFKNADGSTQTRNLSESQYAQWSTVVDNVMRAQSRNRVSLF